MSWSFWLCFNYVEIKLIASMYICLVDQCTPNKFFLAQLQANQLLIMAGLGVPVKLLHESLGHIITVELKTGQLYRGKLAEGA